jgi:hypothetical protein
VREHPIFLEEKLFEESIFSSEKIVLEHPIFLPEKLFEESIFLGGKIYLRPLREDRRCREERRCLVFLADLDDLRPLR